VRLRAKEAGRHNISTVPIRLAILLLLLSAGTLAGEVVPHLRLEPAAGTMVLETSAILTPIPGLWLDGLFQKNFEAAGPGRYRNASLDLVVENLSPAAVAATWSSGDQRVHDFRLRIKSDDETEYYGTGERF
jgi:hypothetical protein